MYFLLFFLEELNLVASETIPSDFFQNVRVGVNLLLSPFCFVAGATAVEAAAIRAEIARCPLIQLPDVAVSDPVLAEAILAAVAATVRVVL